MPGINHKALDLALSLAEDILKLGVDETLELNFKDKRQVYKRIE